MTPAHVKLCFEIVSDEDGYPGVGVESLWARTTDHPDELVLDNIPFHAREATLGDRVRAVVRNGQLWFDGVLERGGSSLIRVVVYDADRVQEVRDHLSSLGCSSERMRRLIAVDVPAQADLVPVQQYLAELEARDELRYEEPLLNHPVSPS